MVLKKIRNFFLIKLPLFFIAFTILWVLVLKWVPVVVTPLMVKRAIEYKEDDSFRTQKKWVSFKKISPEMAKAAISAEDNLFVDHNGFDKKAIEKAIEDHNKGKKLRGASTITQQTAKNVFCWPSRSFVRKAFEAYFTVLIEYIWGKERILEVYLNVAEMGKGIYGAEAAAKHYFGHSAASLTRRESCLIAAALPDPISRNPAKPSSYLSQRASKISKIESGLTFPSWVTER